MFTIFRSEAAVTPLREVFQNADEGLRESILQASERVNHRLHIDPLGQGESREPGTRILFEAPLGVLFEVDEHRKLVSVLRSWAYRVGADAQGERE